MTPFAKLKEHANSNKGPYTSQDVFSGSEDSDVKQRCLKHKKSSYTAHDSSSKETYCKVSKYIGVYHLCIKTRGRNKKIIKPQRWNKCW